MSNIEGEIAIPVRGWKPRPHQKKLWSYLARGGKRAVAVWHRRAGKDEICLHATAVAMLERPGNYWHCLPAFSHARKAIWDSVNPHSGARRIDEAFPQSMRSNTRDHDMHIRCHNGSTWQVIGSDAVTSGSGLGSSTAGIVFSEYALANPSAWAYYRPILEENNGWAVFISTPRGRNHCFDMFKYASHAPGWFCELLTAEDTEALTRAQLDEALAEMCALYGVDAGTGQYRQEYLCDWAAGFSLGAFYSHEMAQVRSEGRITDQVVPPPGTPINRSWDLGVGHSTSIWMFAAVGSQVYVFDHYVASGVGLEHYRDVIERLYAEHGWTHGVDYVPHDARVTELGTGRTRVETMRQLGFNPMLAPAASLDDGINAVRRTLPLCVFHPRCDEGRFSGIGGLEQYKREWDDELKTFKKSALADWTTDIADSFRYLALSWKPAPPRKVVVPQPKGWTGWRIPPPDEPRRYGIRL